MNWKGCLVLASSLGGIFAAPSPAFARDTAATSSGWAHESDPVNAGPIPEVAHFPAIAATVESQTSAAGSDAVGLDDNDGARLRDLCKRQCGAAKDMRRLPQLIADNLAGSFPGRLDAPAIRALMVPVMTIEAEDGRSSVTFAVKPTKLTSGTGFVAIGRF